MRTLRAAILILFIGLLGVIVMAQGSEECDYTALAQRLAEASEGLEGSEDPAGDVSALQAELSSFSAACSGLAFDSETEGLQPVIGPVEIPEGLYRLVVTTPGYYIMDIEPLEGECGPRGGFSTNVLNISRDTATEGAEALVESSGCEALLVIDNVTDAWRVSFEKIR